MKLKIEVDLSNDAFIEDEEMLKLLLIKLAETLSVMKDGSMSIMDTNGNTVGFARYCEY